MTGKKSKALALNRKEQSLLNRLEKEIQEENVGALKRRAKSLIRDIRRTEIILGKQKDQLKEILSGRVEVTEEELLFADDV